MSDGPIFLPFPQQPFRLGYRPWLDGLRGIAILVVMGCHLHLVRSGLAGLDIFFVLSGFLITTLLVEEWEKTGDIRLGRFLLCRALRITPVLAAVMIGCYAYIRIFRPELLAEQQKAMLAAVCHLSNWPQQIPIYMGPLAHTWSLSLQEQFYLIWPVVLLVCLKWGMSRRWLAALVIAGIAASAIERWAIYHAHGPDASNIYWRLYVGLDTRADCLLIGCLLGLAASWNWLPRSRSAGRILGVLALASAAALVYLAVKVHIYDSRYLDGLFTVTAVLTAIITTRMLVSPSRWELRLLEFGPLVAVGKMSFALYLVHSPVIGYIERPVGWANPGNTLIAIAASFAAALVCYHAVERPSLNFKRLFAAKKPTAAVQPEGMSRGQREAA